MSDGFPSASSARARRGRSVAAATQQKTLGSGIDDFLGGGGSSPPVTNPEPAKMPEPGGWVSDKSGEEKYEPQAGRFPKVDAVCNGTSTETLTGADARELGRRIDAEVVKTRHAIPEGPLHKNDIVLRQQAEARVDAAPKPPVMSPGELDAALSAPRKSNSPDIHPAYGRIVRTLFAFNPDKVFDELDAAMRLPKSMRDMGYLELAELLDQAARHHVNASRLHADAKVKLAQFEADCEAMGGDMRLQAVNELKAEKEKQGGKQITEGDVASRIAMLFPDEHRRQVRLKAEAKATVGHLETLIKAWELRRRELDTMLRECRK